MRSSLLRDPRLQVRKGEQLCRTKGLRELAIRVDNLLRYPMVFFRMGEGRIQRKFGCHGGMFISLASKLLILRLKQMIISINHYQLLYICHSHPWIGVVGIGHRRPNAQRRSTSVNVLDRDRSSQATRTRCVRPRRGSWAAAVRDPWRICMRMCRAFRMGYHVLLWRGSRNKGGWRLEVGIYQDTVEHEFFSTLSCCGAAVCGIATGVGRCEADLSVSFSGATVHELCGQVTRRTGKICGSMLCWWTDRKTLCGHAEAG